MSIGRHTVFFSALAMMVCTFNNGATPAPPSLPFPRQLLCQLVATVGASGRCMLQHLPLRPAQPELEIPIGSGPVRAQPGLQLPLGSIALELAIGLGPVRPQIVVELTMRFYSDVSMMIQLSHVKEPHTHLCPMATADRYAFF